MNAAFLGLLFLTASVSAQILKPIDPRRPADANSKTVDVPTLNPGTVSQPTVESQNVSPLSGRIRATGNVATKNVSVSNVPASAILPMPTVTRQNFVAKRAAVAGAIAPPERIPANKAPVTNRVIYPYTSAGKDELKEQLATPH